MEKKLLKWNLEIDEVHAQVLIEALDIYSRIKMGQLERFEDLFWDRKLTIEQNNAMKDCLDTLKPILFSGMSRGASLGIASPENSESSKIAYGIKRTIEHRKSWDKVGNPAKRDWKTMLGTNFDEPKNYSQHPLPKITTITLKTKLGKLLEKKP